nr:hypothetical protein [Tanacetum cinerariifolium]
AESPGYITDLEPEMEPEEEDRDDEKSEEDFIDYPASRGDDDADDDAPTVPAPALHSSISASEDFDQTEPFEEGETAATPPPFGYRVTARISVRPHIPMPFRSDESVPKADMLLRKRARFTTPTGGYEVGESSVAAAAKQIRPTLTVANSRRAEDRLIGRLRRERRYFCTLSTNYANEVAHSHDYCTQIMDYCQSREVHTSTLVTQIEALQRDKMAPKRSRTIRANPDPTRTTTATEPMTQEAINNLIAQRVTEALAEYETQRNIVVNGDTSHTTRTGPRTVRPTRECTYNDYLNCGPLKFNDTKGVIGEAHGYHQLYSPFPRVNSVVRENVS